MFQITIVFIFIKKQITCVYILVQPVKFILLHIHIKTSENIHYLDK